MTTLAPKEHHSELTFDGVVWSVDASAAGPDPDHLTVELLAASESDGTLVAQLRLDGDASHLALLEDVARDLQSRLCGRPPRRRPNRYRLATIRTKIPRAYAPWTEDDEALLLERWDAGDTVEDLAATLQRGPGGIRSRLIKLGRIEEAS